MVSSTSSVGWSGPALSFSFSCVIPLVYFKKNKKLIWKNPPTPLKLGPPRLRGPMCCFPTRCTSKRGHQQNHLDCSHGFDLKSLISVESAFVINYYKSISGGIRKCVFSRAKSFPYDFLRIVSLASSGFPSNWGVKNTSEIIFSAKNGVVYKMKNN